MHKTKMLVLGRRGQLGLELRQKLIDIANQLGIWIARK
jgi:dTDP-4-dehydrorhamnose reductase